MKEQDEVTVNVEDDILVYLVYFTGSELPTAVFWDLEIALRFCEHFTHDFVEKEIRTARVWDVAGPLFRDRTQFFARVSNKNLEDEGLT